ncbi:hypothetical protein PVK06_042863 [Gossypium arboreum]|uniref:Uncharacterized protein n=1 Tax=Gossypium arboreum TaxID=29729 RepID=A0ABR0MMA8_GOSAR|nr:hypothetical protein PVK06_042863 [Gossypium arboreum]
MVAGKFSMHESYKHICCPISSNQLEDDEVIWKMKIPQRVRTFLWMLVRNKILTNKERARRGMLNIDGGEWSTLFSIVTWFIWKNRNAFIFKNASSSNHELIASALTWTKSCRYNAKMFHLACSSKTEQRWQRPDSGWVKINVDGSVSKNNTKAVIGETMQNSDGEWLTRFNMVTDIDEIFRIELRAIVEWMKLAWLEGYKQVEINCDNVMLIDTICNGFASISNITKV